MVMGITIGVAVAVAIDLANASSAKALELSTQSLVGKATHQVFAPPAGLDEAVFIDSKPVSIIFIQSIFSSKPHISLCIHKNTSDIQVRKPILSRKMFEFIILGSYSQP